MAAAVRLRRNLPSTIIEFNLPAADRRRRCRGPGPAAGTPLQSHQFLTEDYNICAQVHHAQLADRIRPSTSINHSNALQLRINEPVLSGSSAGSCGSSTASPTTGFFDQVTVKGDAGHLGSTTRRRSRTSSETRNEQAINQRSSSAPSDTVPVSSRRRTSCAAARRSRLLPVGTGRASTTQRRGSASRTPATAAPQPGITPASHGHVCAFDRLRGLAVIVPDGDDGGRSRHCDGNTDAERSGPSVGGRPHRVLPPPPSTADRGQVVLVAEVRSEARGVVRSVVVMVAQGGSWQGGVRPHHEASRRGPRPEGRALFSGAQW